MPETEPDHVKIFDTTLRDGEQSPGISLAPPEKLEIARQLERLGVDVIEAGFAISSPGEVAGISLVAEHVRGCTIASLARTHAADIDAAAEALKGAESPRIHVFIATSPIHMEHKLRLAPDEVVRQAREAVAYARRFVPDVEFSCEDATRSEVPFMAEVVRGAVEAGATTINLPDTVGYTQPDEYAAMFAEMLERVPELAGVTLSVHCHDDLGMAVANSIAGVAAGARQVECTVNGIGERAGNAALEEIVMLLRTRQPKYGLTTSIHGEEIARTSRMVSRMTGYVVQPNKAIVGRNAFAHEAGIHQDGVLKHRRTYEIMDAESVGLSRSELVLGKHSGRAALRNAYAEMGYEIDGEELRAAFRRFKQIADRKKHLTALDLEAILDDSSREREDRYRLSSLEISTRSGRPAWARVEIVEGADDGAPLTGTAEGDGPIDAALSAVDAAITPGVELREYEVQAVTGGPDALGEVRVLVADERGRTFAGQAVATDTAEASVQAFLRACSHARSVAENPAGQPTVKETL
jgi:2-isopropylmalate synthase